MEIRKKPFYKRLGATIALRVFYLSIAFIVVPMIFHTFWMYKRDYLQRQKELITSLSILAESKAALLQELVDDKFNIMAFVEGRFFLEEESFQLNQTFSEYLENIANEFHLSELLFLLPNGDCIASSNPNLIGKAFHETFLTDEFEEPSFAMFGVLPHVNQKRLIAGKTISQQGILIATSRIEDVLARLISYIQAPYEIDISLLMKNRIIFASTDPSLNMRALCPLDPKLLKGIQESGQLGSLEIYQGQCLLSRLPNVPGGYALFGKENAFGVRAFVKDTFISLLLDVDEKEILAIQMKEYLLMIVSLLGSIVVLGGGLAFLLTLKMAKPLKNLQQVMRQVSQGNLTAKYLPHKMGFEINYIGDHFNETITALIQHQSQAEQEKLAKERIAQELNIGYEIQKALLPTKLVEMPGLDIATGFLPAKEVGGDFYDLFIRQDRTLLITIADTAGKGIEACLYSLGLRSILRSFASTYETLEEIIQKTNELFCLDTKESSMFVTLFAGLYNPKTKTFTYCNMGHLPPYLQKKDSKIETLTTKGLALGVNPKMIVETATISIHPTDSLFLFTDGVIEAENGKKEFFGVDRLFTYLKQEKSSSQKRIDHLLEEIQSFCGQEPFADDLTVVAIRFL